MTNLDYLELIDETLADLEDTLKGKEGNNCTKARSYLEKIKQQLNIHAVSQRSEPLKPKVQVCYKSNKPCEYDCAGLCKESC